ncbi:MAG: hypothetical protein KatS3mg076_2731 [Candidatus Binatia bacterium]|nr:MAG: hypothetical protein KatS3mg076_2731 [Candidatus Binatia bacterium]
MPKLFWGRVAYKVARRIVVSVVGFTVLGIGVVLLVTPGPAFLVIPAGLGILALEFEFARRWLRWVKERAQSTLGSSPEMLASGARRTEGGSSRDAGNSGKKEEGS